MPTVKEHVRNLLDDLPDDISWKQLRHEIWAMEQIEIGMAQIDRGETVPHAQVMKDVEDLLAELNARDLIKGIRQAEDDFKNGHFKTHKQALKEIDAWAAKVSGAKKRSMAAKKSKSRASSSGRPTRKSLRSA